MGPGQCLLNEDQKGQANLVSCAAVIRDWLPVPQEGKALCAEGAVH